MTFWMASLAEAGERRFRDHTRDNQYRFCHEMPLTVVPNHPDIMPIAAAIRAITTEPLEQVVVVNDVTHLLVDYDEDGRVYGCHEYHATLDEMIARRRAAGWIYLRDDCDGRAVFAAHVLAALGIPWRLEASYWKRHAWVVARVGGVEYDLLAFRPNAPEQRHVAYRTLGHFFVHATRPPPYFPWRQGWLQRTNADLEIGKRLGVLELDSTPTYLHERHATDWTACEPKGRISPSDPRMATTSVAGFPLGESLNPGVFARGSLSAFPGRDQPNTGRSLADVSAIAQR